MKREATHTEPVAGGIFSRLRSDYATLSQKEKAVADYLLKATDGLYLLSISDLALKTRVSEATLVRMAKKLNFQGFSDFKRALLSEMLTDQNVPKSLRYQEITVGDSASTVLSKLHSLMQTALQDTFQQLDVQAFEEAVEIVARSSRIELYGHGGSGYILQASVNKFMFLGLNCVAQTDQFTLERYASFLGTGHVALALSHTGRTKTVFKALDAARRQGVPTIAITSNPLSPIAEIADIHLRTAVPETIIGSDAGVTRVAQGALIDSLAVAASLRRAQLADSGHLDRA